MRKKGFTLIELLAVIVILAIIALIATPIVMNVIENSRKGAAERSAENYVDAVELAIASERLKGLVEDGVYEIQEDGSLCPKAGCGEKDKNKINVAINGNKPKAGGKILIQNHSVVDELGSDVTSITIGSYTKQYDPVKKQYVTIKDDSGNNNDETGNEGTNEGTICTYVAEAGTTEKTVGAKYTCTLGGEDRTFYILELGSAPVENSALSSSQVALIMDKNIIENTSWCDVDADADCEELKSLTSGWGVQISFATTKQALAAEVDYSVPEWLKGNLDGEEQSKAFWLKDCEDPSTSHGLLNWLGMITSQPIDDVAQLKWGIRPTIIISNNQLQ